MNAMDSPVVLIVGSANVDMVTTTPRCPRPGETLIGTSFKTVGGGKGANQAVASARLGARTYFAGCVGADAFGEMQRSSLGAAGVDVTYLKKHLTEPTGVAIIYVAETGQNSIVVVPAANGGVTPEDVVALRPLFRKLDCVLLQLEIPLDAVEAALDLARETGVLSILDAGPAQAVSESLLRKADVVSPNETEAEAITGVAVDSVESARKAAERIIEMGAREVVMKLGANGCLYLGEECVYAPPFKISPVDTTAAGDAFTAALGNVWKRLSIHDALRYANATGALAATIAGAQPSMPTAEQVEAFLRANE
jgi:ribokinase